MEDLLKEHGADELCNYAARTGRLDVLMWARQQNCKWKKWTCSYAAQNGHLHIIKWAYANGCPQYTCAYAFAAQEGHMHILEWVFSNIPLNIADTSLCCYAASGGHLNILKWLREKGCALNAETCAWAASRGHLHVLKWLREQNCPWDDGTCRYAIRESHLNILKWARENGCDWDLHEYVECALISETPLIIYWLLNNGGTLTKAQLKENQKMRYFPPRDFKYVKWLHETHGFYGCSSIKQWLTCIETSLMDILWVSDLADVIKNYI